MPSPTDVKALADLGGLGLFLFTVITAGIGLFRGWVVPGWIYKQEREARLTAETQALRNAEAIEKLARAVSRDRARSRADSPDDA